MTESIFERRTLSEIYGEICDVYLNDERPWILGFSGGKDSTCMVQIVWNALRTLPKKDRTKRIHVISSDTLVESPQIVDRITQSLDRIERAAAKAGLPVSTNLLRPPVSNTFWVRILGFGYPAPTSMFRWCTDMLKISNADRFITEKVSEHGEVVVLLGTRKDESITRHQSMNLLEIKNSVLSHHKKFAQTYVYTPLVDFTTDDVWNYLLQNKNPWGDKNRDLLALYQDANASECPLVVDDTTPSCGSGRFGCWTCTVVDRQKSLDSLIENGQEWMEPLAELRHELKLTQDAAMWPKIREISRRSGNVDLKTDGSDYTPGPYTMAFRKEYLEKLLRGQQKVRQHDPDMTLISEDEIHEIQRMWRTEQGDWQDSAYAIYEKVCGIRLEQDSEDAVVFGGMEQKILEAACQNHDVPYKLVSTLLGAEHEALGKSTHSRVFARIDTELKKEWRTDINQIKKELFEHRDAMDEVRSNAA